MKKIVFFILLLLSSFELSAQIYGSSNEVIRFDSGDDGNSHRMFSADNNPNPFNLNNGYSLPTLWRNGEKISFTQGFNMGGINLPSIPAFGCSDIPGAEALFDFLGLDCSRIGFPGFSFGVGVFIDFNFEMELDVDFVDFGQDSMRIEYPARITLESPQDNTYNSGDWVSLNSDFELDVTESPVFKTYYPETGRIETYLDVDLEIAASIGIRFNLFGFQRDWTYPIVNFDVNDFLENTIGMSDSRIPIYKVDSVRSYCLGKIMPPPFSIREPAWLPNFPPYISNLLSAYKQCDGVAAEIPNVCQAGQFYDDDLPLEPSEGPISGMFTLPYVETEVSYNGNAMIAKGDSLYTAAKLSVPQLLAMIIDIPEIASPTIKAAQEAAVFVLEHLSFSQLIDLPGDDDIELGYTLFEADFALNQKNSLEVEFDPDLYGRYVFPVPVLYEVYKNGSLDRSGESTEISYQLKKDSVRFKYPCYFDSMTVNRFYSIDGKVTTTLEDKYNFSFAISAAGINIDIPGFNVFPGFSASASVPFPSICLREVCVWGVCVDFPVPCIQYVDISINIPSITTPSFGFNTCDDFYSDLGLSCDSESGALELLDVDLTPDYGITPWHEESFSFGGFVEKPASSIVLKSKRFSAIASNDSVACFGESTGAINLAITNGVQPFTFDWSIDGQGDNDDSQNLSNVPTGVYSVTVTDANGCTFHTGTTVHESTVIEVNSVLTDASCKSANSGSIDITVAGGHSPYQYDWNTDGVGDFDDPEDASNLIAGNYTLQVRDSKNCVVSSNYDIDEPELLVVSDTIISNVTCFGDSTGSIQVSVQGGTEPYNYSWNNGDSSNTITQLIAGVYELTLTDSKGCSLIKNFEVSQPTQLDLSVTTTDVLCFGGNTGTMDLTVTGGVGGYSFKWYDSNGFLTTNSSEDDLSLSAGNNTVEVTDANGCKSSISALVNEPNLLEISSIDITNLGCKGIATGAIDIEVQGGVQNYSYQWSTSNGQGLVQNNQDQTNLSAGNYSVVVTDNNNCIVQGNYVVVEPQDSLSLSFDVTNVLCHGGSTGSIDLTVAGGTSPYRFDWNIDGVADSEDFNGITAGTYNVQVLDANDCSITDSAIVEQPLMPLSLSESHQDVLCFGRNTGSIDLTVSGGTSPYEYQWSDSNSVLLSNTNEDLGSLYANHYTVLVKDSNQCQEQISVQISQPQNPISISGLVNDVDCFGNSTGSINISVNGGTPGYTFDWDNDGVSDFDDLEDLTGLVSGDYAVVVRDNNQCLDSLSFNVEQPNEPVSISVLTVPAKCFGETTGSISLNVSGGTPGYEYDWDIDGTSDFDDDEDQNGLASGFYNVQVRDMNGCIYSSGGYVGQPNQGISVQEILTQPSCFGISDGSIQLDVSGGFTPYRFEWGDSNQVQLNNPSETLANIVSGRYYYRVYDRNNCKNESYVDLSQPDTLKLSSFVTSPSCYNGNDGEIDITVNGGTLPYSFSWSNGQQVEDAVNVSAGQIIITVKDDNDCELVREFTVDEPSDIIVQSTIEPLSCIDETDANILISTSGGSSPYSWDWSNGQTTEDLTNVGAGNYQLTVQDENQCSNSFNFIIDSTRAECIAIVNTFSPNGDDYNDVWVIDNLELYPNAEVRVFNRWGGLVFESIGKYTPWDGSYNGKMLPSEVYYYVIDLKNQVKNEYKGIVSIIR